MNAPDLHTVIGWVRALPVRQRSVALQRALEWSMMCSMVITDEWERRWWSKLDNQLGGYLLGLGHAHDLFKQRTAKEA